MIFCARARKVGKKRRIHNLPQQVVEAKRWIKCEWDVEENDEVSGHRE